MLVLCKVAHDPLHLTHYPTIAIPPRPRGGSSSVARDKGITIEKASDSEQTNCNKHKKRLLIRCPCTPCIVDGIRYLGPHLKEHGITDPRIHKRCCDVGSYICPDCRLEFCSHESSWFSPKDRCWEHYETCTGCQTNVVASTCTQTRLLPTEPYVTSSAGTIVAASYYTGVTAPTQTFLAPHQNYPHFATQDPFPQVCNFDLLNCLDQGVHEAWRGSEEELGVPTNATIPHHCTANVVSLVREGLPSGSAYSADPHTVTPIMDEYNDEAMFCWE
jgi:hypothetical protein